MEGSWPKPIIKFAREAAQICHSERHAADEVIELEDVDVEGITQEDQLQGECRQFPRQPARTNQAAVPWN